MDLYDVLPLIYLHEMKRVSRIWRHRFLSLDGDIKSCNISMYDRWKYSDA